MSRKVSILSLLVLAGLVGFGQEARSQVVVVNTRNGVVWNDFVNWAVLSPLEGGVPNPDTFSTNGGLSATASQPGLTFGHAIEGGSWGGNFALNDHLLWTNRSTGQVTITFASLISGGGAQFQSFNGGPFTAFIDALDAGNNVLASFSKAGSSNSNEDNSAIFLGVQSNLVNIHALRFNVHNGGGSDNAFAINRLDLRTTALGVPEPGVTAFTFALGVPVLLGLRKRMRNEG